jgi:hypothetical protein
MALAVHAADSFTRQGDYALAQAIFSMPMPTNRRASRWQRVVTFLNRKVW